MSEKDKEEESVEVSIEEIVRAALADAADQVTEGMLSQGYSPEFVSSFVCLRFHPEHKWGVGFVMLNNEHKIEAIVVPAQEEGVHQVHFVSYHPSMKLIDRNGNPIVNGFSMPGTKRVVN